MKCPKGGWVKIREVQEKLLGTKKNFIDFWDINNQLKKSASWVPQISGGGGHPNSGNAQI